MHAGKKKHGFLIFMLVWSLLLIAAGTVGIFYLRNYLAEYEASRTGNIVDAFSRKLVSGDLDPEEFTVLDRIDTRLQSKEEAMTRIRSLLSGAKLYKAVDESTDTLTVYRIKNGSDLIGRAKMAPVSVTDNGFSLWDFTETEFYLDQYLSHAEYTVPASFSVQVNGQKLDSSYITAESVPYETLSAFYSAYTGLPAMVTYTGGDVLGPVPEAVYDNNGNLLQPEELTETVFLNRSCPADRDAELREATTEFVLRYAEYTSNVTGYTTANYARIKALVIPESDLHNRLRLAFDSMAWGAAEDCEITAQTIHIVCRLKEALYLTDVSYTVDVDGRRADTNIRLIYTPDELNNLKAERMTTY